MYVQHNLLKLFSLVTQNYKKNIKVLSFHCLINARLMPLTSHKIKS